MANWTQKKLIGVVAGGAAVVCLAAGAGVYWVHGEIEAIEAQVTQKNEAITAAETKIAQIPGLEKDVIILRENLDEYVKILPDNKELNEFVRMLNAFERQSGIQSSGLIGRPRRDAKKVERFTPIEYSFEMTATLWQCIKFMNLVENYERFVSITDFSIQSGSGGRGTGLVRDGDVVHQVKMTLQTYSYNGKADSKEVKIPDYAAQREALREEIWKRMQAIRLDRYEHRGQQGRRDILVDPRERGDQPTEGPTPAEQRAVLDRYVGEVTRLREMQQRIKKQDATLFEQYSLEKGLKDGLEKLGVEMESDAARITYAPYRLRWAREVVAPLDELRAQLDAAAKSQPTRADPYLPKKELEQLVADLDADCKSGQLEQARDRYESIASRVNVPSDDPRHPLAVAAKAWHVKATTALAFKSLDLKITGLVVNRDGRSGILLNGEVYEEGEYVSDDLLVKMVEEEQVWFVYRGLTLVRTM